MLRQNVRNTERLLQKTDEGSKIKGGRFIADFFTRTQIEEMLIWIKLKQNIEISATTININLVFSQ